jgi:hypothetical protein
MEFLTMQTLQNGIEVPTNSDTYKLTEHLANMGDKANVIIPVPTKDVRDGLAGKYAGMTVARLDLGARLETWNGSGWITQGPYAEFANEAVLNTAVVMNGQVGPFYQAFPAGRFTVAPIVTLGTSNARLSASWNNVTKDGFDLYVRNDSDLNALTGAIITFTAKQMTATSAAG